MFFLGQKGQKFLDLMEITQLIRRCRQGDRAALGELYQTYAKQMRSVCRRYLSDSQSINDAIHDSFVIIYTSLDKLRDDSKAEAWMMSIARNVASKYKDYQTKHQAVSFDKTGKKDFWADETQDEFKELSMNEITSLIEKLPTGYGKIFKLSVLEGLSHKEIAAMLNIKPHSSSSQLARAKKLLRSMIQKSWPALLLLLIPVTFLLLHKENPVSNEESPIVTTHEEKTTEMPTEQTQESVIVHKPTKRNFVPATKTQSATSQTNEPVISDTVNDMIAHKTIVADTLHDSQVRDTIQFMPKPETAHYDLADLFPNNGNVKTMSTSSSRWSLEFAYAGSFDKQNASQSIIHEIEIDVDGPGFKPGEDNIIVTNDTVLYTTHHYMPLTLTLLAHYKQSKRFGIETGISYMRLVSDFEKDTNKTITRGQLQTIHYLGVPIKGIYNFATIKGWNLYGNLGVTMEIPIHSQFNTNEYPRDKANTKVPWLWSLSTGAGLQYNITPHIGIFAEPSVLYYLPTHSGLETYCTEHPFTFSLPVGIKVIW